MKEYIECRYCDSPNCSGCNVLTLSEMLYNGKFDCIMDEYHSINPAADVVERKRGEWQKGDNLKPKCSVCGEYHLYSWSDHRKCNFCPNCGCQMVGDKDGRD